MRRSGFPIRFSPAKESLLWRILLLISVLVAVLVSIFAAGRNFAPNASILNMRNGFGPVVQGIVKQHRLGLTDQNYGWWCYACRMPVVPILGAISYRLSPKTAVFLVLKNVVVWVIWVYAFLRLKRRYCIPDKLALVTVALLILAPYDLSVGGQVEVEEGYLFALLALLFSLLLSIEGRLSAGAAGLTLAAIYLTKSSMLPLCVVAAAWIFVKYRKRGVWLVAAPATILASAILGWGFYIQAESGAFAVGIDASSWNGWNFYKGNNPYANSLYPRTILDTLDHANYAHRLLPYATVHNEWELSHAQLALGRDFVRLNPGAVVKMDLKKLFVACCDLGESPQTTPGHTRLSMIFSNLVNHIAFAVVLIAALFNVIRHKATDAEVLAIILAVAYVAPYVSGFLYMRHMVPVYGLIALTAAIQLAWWQADVRRVVTSLDEVPAALTLHSF
jgi:hypothetical protein